MTASVVRRGGVAVLVALGATVFGAATDTAQALQTPTSCPNRVRLVNGDFETPIIGASTFQFLAPTAVGWSTTDGNGEMELWSDNFLGGSAFSGRQWAEMEAYTTGQLSQVLATTPGQTLYWRLAHTSRGAGTDVAQVRIGSAAEGVTSPVALTSTGISQLADSNQVWGQYRGTYVVPVGQTQTHFGIETVSNSFGVGGGNHLDDVVIDTPACVIVTKQAFDETGAALAQNAPVQVNDVITYRISAVNRGGVAAANTRITDVLPAGVAYVPGSLQVLSGPGIGALTDVAGDDAGQVAGQTVTVAVGAGATSTGGGSLATDETLTNGTTVELKVRVLNSTSGLTTNTASLRFDDTLSGATDVPALSNDVDLQVPTTSTPTSTSSTTSTTAVTLSSTSTSMTLAPAPTASSPTVELPTPVLVPVITGPDPIVLPATTLVSSVEPSSVADPTSTRATNGTAAVVAPNVPSDPNTQSSGEGRESEAVLAFTGPRTFNVMVAAFAAIGLGALLLRRSKRTSS